METEMNRCAVLLLVVAAAGCSHGDDRLKDEVRTFCGDRSLEIGVAIQEAEAGNTESGAFGNLAHEETTTAALRDFLFCTIVRSNDNHEQLEANKAFGIAIDELFRKQGDIPAQAASLKKLLTLYQQVNSWPIK
jgi:hypothetical protein